MTIILLNRLPQNKYNFTDWLRNYQNKIIMMCPEEIIVNSDDNIERFGFKNFSVNGNVEKKVLEICKEQDVERIYSFEEAYVTRSAALRTKLNIDGQSLESAELFRNKIKMKNQLKNKGILTPNYKEIGTIVDLLIFIEKNGYPIIIKPINGMSSINTYKIEDAKNLEHFLENNNPIGCMVEEYIQGEMFHYDGLVINEDLKFSSLTKYEQNSLTYKEGEGLVSFLLKDTNPLQEHISKYANEVLDALITPLNYIFHLEFFINPKNKIIFCEIASRIGGGNISKMLELAYDINLDKELLQVDLNLKNPEDIHFISNERVFAKKNYLVKNGKLIKIPETPPYRWCLNYKVKGIIGKEYFGPKAYFDNYAQVIIVGDNEEELKEKINVMDTYMSLNTRWENIKN